ncbi:ABC transporter substrate-binding protein [Patulibacter sp. S7RM1-6]
MPLPRPRRVLPLLAALVAGVPLAGCAGQGPPPDVDLGSGPARAGTVRAGALDGVVLTFTSYGGAFQAGQMEGIVEPFAKASGARVLEDGPTEYAKVRAQVDNDFVTWDVVDTDAVWSDGQCGKLLQPLDYSIIDASKVPEGQATRCSVPAMNYATVIAYDERKFGGRTPQGWKDFYDVKRFPGKRAIFGGSGDAAPGDLEGALLADGVKPEDLYPLDVDRALRKMDTIREHLVFWDTGARAQQMLESGEVVMATVWSGRAYAAIKNGAPFEVQWNQFVPRREALVVPKGARSPKASMALINYYLGREQQERLTELTSYSPINVDARPDLDPLAQSFVTTTPERQRQALKVDNAWWAENQPRVIEKFTAWLAG